MNTAQSITSVILPSIRSIFTVQCNRKAGNIVKDTCHPGHPPFSHLSSEKRYRRLRAQMSRTKNSFLSTAIILLNQSFVVNSYSWLLDYCTSVHFLHYFRSLHNLCAILLFLHLLSYLFIYLSIITLYCLWASWEQGISMFPGVYDNKQIWIWIWTSLIYLEHRYHWQNQHLLPSSEKMMLKHSYSAVVHGVLGFIPSNDEGWVRIWTDLIKKIPFNQIILTLVKIKLVRNSVWCYRINLNQSSLLHVIF